ncbi:ammonium transporter, partial [Mannheimia haemolytica]
MLETIDPATTAWLLISTALVLLMTPGLALFYGGMVRSKGVLNMIMMSFISIALVTVVWLVAGYSLAFGDDLGGGLIGG